jgi:hypothetical protein
LSATSNAWVRNSDRYIGVGGGAVANDEMQAMIAKGKRVNYIAQDANHTNLDAKHVKKGLAAPTASDYRGPAQQAYEMRRAAVLAKRNGRLAERELLVMPLSPNAPREPLASLGRTDPR